MKPLALLASLAVLVVAVCVMAQATHDDHKHHQHSGGQTPAIAASPQQQGTSDHDPHRHGTWATPPAEYASLRGNRWADLDAVKRGQELFRTHCQTCHGPDGKGTGPGAKGLEHPPADLSNHFHNQPGDGDAYLFWRVSEGGVVEPFKSMKSAMPAFKAVLNEAQRWDVLAYVHVYFHLGLVQWQVPTRSP